MINFTPWKGKKFNKKSIDKNAEKTNRKLESLLSKPRFKKQWTLIYERK